MQVLGAMVAGLVGLAGQFLFLLWFAAVRPALHHS
jgi:hypothetical protein